MTHPFSAIWLLDAQASMGIFFDILLRGLAVPPEKTTELFLHYMACRYESGNSLYFSYFDGRKVVWEIFMDKGQLEHFDENMEVDIHSRAYWAGWALCYYQWYTNHPFKDILSSRSLKDILDAYDNLHDRPLSHFVAFMEQAYLADSTVYRLPYQLVDPDYMDRNVILGRFQPKRGRYTIADIDARLLNHYCASIAIPSDISCLLNWLLDFGEREQPEQMKAYWTPGARSLEMYRKAVYLHGTYRKLQKGLEDLYGLLADKDAWRKRLTENKIECGLYTAYIDYDESIIGDYKSRRKIELLVEQAHVFRNIVGTVSRQLKGLFEHAGKRTRLVLYGDATSFPI